MFKKILIIVMCAGMFVFADQEQIINLNAGSSKVIKMSGAIRNIAMGNTEIADVILVSKAEILINAKKAGITTLTLWDAQKNIDYKIVVTKGPDQMFCKIYKLNNLSLTDCEFDNGDSNLKVTIKPVGNTIDDLSNVLKTILDSTQFSVSPWTNSIMVVGSEEDHRKTKEIIDRVDTKEPQVMFEVEVYELKDESLLSKELNIQFTKNYALNNNSSVENDVSTGFDNTNGLNYTFNNRSYTATGTLAEYTSHVLKMLQTDGKATLLAKPKILSLSNKYAMIYAGEKIPISQTDSEGKQTVEYLHTGVMLGVVPRVDMVSKNINCWIISQVSSVTGYNATTGYPTVGSRESENEVRIQDNSVLIIGGLLKETETISHNKVPILGDLLGWIPWVGGFFNNESKEKGRTELVVSLKPKIIFEEK